MARKLYSKATEERIRICPVGQKTSLKYLTKITLCVKKLVAMPYIPTYNCQLAFQICVDTFAKKMLKCILNKIINDELVSALEYMSLFIVSLI